MGERLKIARHMAEMSQRALAKQTDVSATAISKYENGKMTPSSDVLIQLARALDVPVGFFLRLVTTELTAPAFRRRTRLKKSAQNAILAKTHA